MCQVAGLVAGVDSLVLLDACGFAFSVLVGCVTVWFLDLVALSEICSLADLL